MRFNRVLVASEVDLSDAVHLGTLRNYLNDGRGLKQDVESRGRCTICILP